MNPPWGTPFKRAGQVSRDDAPDAPDIMPAEERADLLQQIQLARAEASEWKRECERLASIATADIIDRYEQSDRSTEPTALREARNEIARLRTILRAYGARDR